MKPNESRLENQPKYKIGHAVKVKIKTSSKETGMEFENEVEGYISEIRACGTSEKDTYEYGVTLDMPGCYHSGKRPFAYYIEDNIKITPSSL